MATPSNPSLILAINAGSSSVKISVFTTSPPSLASDPPTPTHLLEIQISGLTAPPSTLSFAIPSQPDKSVKGQELPDVKSQDDAFKYMLDYLIDHGNVPQISRKEDVTHTCHRVVHGGEYFGPVIISPDAMHHLERLTDLAPLHNAPALSIIRTCTTVLPPTTRNIAFFDTSFHATLPRAIHTYPIAPSVAARKQLRKYGFHGLSYSFITRAISAHLQKPARETNLILLHLGSGASACAVRGGKSVDTSMGLTPLAGLPGATRSGDIDPSLVFHYTSTAAQLSPHNTAEMHISTAEEILNKKCGWKALTGTTDFAKIAESEDEMCQLAFDIFVDRVCGFVGLYFVSLGGVVDGLVFAGGIGERSVRLRREVVKRCGCLGFELDEERNEGVGGVEGSVVDVSKEREEGKRVLVCRTDEQFEMARQCVADQELWGA